MGISGELYELIENYLSGRSQRLILNVQSSSWRQILTGLPQGSVLGPLLLFLIYINDLPNGLKTKAKLLADDTSLFIIVKDINESANTLNNDLYLISELAFNWKIIQIRINLLKKFYFQGKIKYQFILSQVLIIFNWKKRLIKKNLGLFLDEKLTFKHHTDNTLSKVNKGTAVIKKLRHDLPQKSLFKYF